MKHKKFDIYQVMAILTAEIGQWPVPIVTEMAQINCSAFKVLISTVLSLRTKDETTKDASLRLYEQAETPQAMVELPEAVIAQLVYPVGFYRRKATSIHKICRILLDTYNGQVPADMEQLLALPGVGRKTANLVLTLGHNLPGICVDTHVHRITNRWGYLKTTTPDKTEFALRKILPQEFWQQINDLLVTYGQHLCRPQSPFCSTCKLHPFCQQVAVSKYR